MTSAAHVHAVTAEVEQMKKMYPEARVTTETHRMGTVVKVWGELTFPHRDGTIGYIDVRPVWFGDDE